MEVKSGGRTPDLRGLSAFGRRYPRAQRLVLGEVGLPIAEALKRAPLEWAPER